MLLRRSMMWITACAGMIESVKTKQTKRWLPLWMRFPGKKDSGGMLWHENTINVKQKLGLGAKKRKKILSEGWAQNLANELHQPIRRRFPKRRVYFHMGLTNIWAADLVEMGKFSKWKQGDENIS